MSRPRTPTPVLELNGAFKKNPQRAEARRDEPVPTGTLGEPPRYLKAREKTCWLELAELAPWMTNADRPLVELAARLWAKIRQFGIGGNMGATIGEVAQYKDCLIRMGMTPADRSKVHAPKHEEDDNPFTDLDGKKDGGHRPN